MIKEICFGGVWGGGCYNGGVVYYEEQHIDPLS